MLRNKTVAPYFRLPDTENNEYALADLRSGKPLVIHFCRGAFCPTAHKDLLLYNDLYDRIQALGADLVAISVDTPQELRRLKHQLGLQFRMLSDGDFSVSERYGIYLSDEVEAGPQPHGEPAVFVLDVDGKIVFSQVQSGPKAHANPAEIVMILIFMAQNGGRYW